MTSKFLVRSVIKIFVVALVLALVHFYLLENVLPDIYKSGPYWANYLFNVPFTLLVFLVCTWMYKIDKTTVGKTYFVFVFLKMFAAVGFLAPWLFWKNDYSTPMVHQFFVVFFVMLFVEVKLLVRLLNNGSGEISKNDENQ